MAATSPVRRKKRHFRTESNRTPFDIECELTEDGEVPEAEGHVVETITVGDFQKLPGADGFEFLRMSQRDPEAALKLLIGDQWDRFWNVEKWRDEELGSILQLLNEATEHYSGASTGNS